MTSIEAITLLNKMRSDLASYPKVNGLAALQKALRGSVHYLTTYRVDGSNIPDLFYNQRRAELEAIDIVIADRAELDKRIQR